MKKINCDVVVVGAGPGGSMAAKTCAKYGLDTVLVERKEYPSKPHVSSRLVERKIADYIKIEKEYIEYPAYKMVDISPDGTEISMSEPYGYEMAYVVNRKTFDRKLLENALKEGFEYINKTRATGLIREDGKIKGIKAKINEKEDVEIRSNIVIGADGRESNVRKWAGLYEPNFDSDDVKKSSVFDAAVDGVKINDEYRYAHCHIYGKDRGGVAFFSQIGDERVGVGTDSARPNSPREMGEFLSFLNNFIKNNPFFSGGKITQTGFGIIPASPVGKITANNVMLVGDAAHQINTPHKSGILNSIDAGALAGRTSAEAYEEGDFSSNFLSRYEKKWYRSHGEHDLIGRYILDAIYEMSDEDINELFHLVSGEGEIFADGITKIINEEPKLTSTMISELESKGSHVKNVNGLNSLIKKYHKVFWDIYVQ